MNDLCLAQTVNSGGRHHRLQSLQSGSTIWLLQAGCGRLNAASEWQVRWIPDAHPITVRLFELPTHTFSSSRAKVQMSRPSSGA